MGVFSNHASNGTTTRTTEKKKKSSGPAALAKNEMKAPQMKFHEWRASSGERWGVVRARIGEKFSVWGADVKLGVYTITHPVHPVRRRAAKEAAKQKKLLAGDVRQQKEAAAHSIAAAKRARARESRVATLNEAVH